MTKFGGRGLSSPPRYPRFIKKNGSYLASFPSPILARGIPLVILHHIGSKTNWLLCKIDDKIRGPLDFLPHSPVPSVHQKERVISRFICVAQLRDTTQSLPLVILHHIGSKTNW